MKNSFLVKSVNERDKAREAELSPQFHQFWELDCQLPEDWKMEISIFDKGAVQITDGLIGSTIIDLENRRHSDPLMQGKTIC